MKWCQIDKILHNYQAIKVADIIIPFMRGIKYCKDNLSDFKLTKYLRFVKKFRSYSSSSSSWSNADKFKSSDVKLTNYDRFGKGLLFTRIFVLLN